jgi:hypothetical protein
VRILKKKNEVEEMATMSEMWKNVVTLGNRIEDIYLRIKTGNPALDEVLIARAEISQVKEDMDILMSHLLEKREWGK